MLQFCVYCILAAIFCIQLLPSTLLTQLHIRKPLITAAPPHVFSQLLLQMQYSDNQPCLMSWHIVVVPPNTVSRNLGVVDLIFYYLSLYFSAHESKKVSVFSVV